MNAPKRISLLLVDNHEVTRVGLRSLLRGFGHLKILADAQSPNDAVAAAEKLAPDVILMDIPLRDGTGIEACRRIRKLGLPSRVLFLTSVADDEVLFAAIACGADGYLLKNANGEALVKAIENVAAGQCVLDPAVTRRVLSRLREVGLPQPPDDRIARLSPQEYRIVALVSEGKTNKEIAAALGLSDKTVKSYLSNAMEKLNTTRRSQTAALFVQHGHR